MTAAAIALALTLAAAAAGALGAAAATYWACQAVPCRWCGRTPDDEDGDR